MTYLLLSLGTLVTVGLLVLTLLVPLVGAQAPPPPTCDDRLSAASIQLQATTVSQLRERGESAQEIAALRKRLGQLEAEVTKLTPKKEAPKPAETPKEKPK